MIKKEQGRYSGSIRKVAAWYFHDFRTSLFVHGKKLPVLQFYDGTKSVSAKFARSGLLRLTVAGSAFQSHHLTPCFKMRRREPPGSPRFSLLGAGGQAACLAMRQAMSEPLIQARIGKFGGYPDRVFDGVSVRTTVANDRTALDPKQWCPAEF